MLEFTCNCCMKIFTKLRLRGSTTTCSKCLSSARVRAWKLANPERAKEINTQPNAESKARYAKSERGMELARVKANRFYHKDIEATRARNRSAYSADRDKHIQRVVDRSKRVRHATPPWADRKTIAKIYCHARALTRSTGIEHHVDHKIPLRSEFVCGLHVEENLQILTAEQNRKKSNRLLPINA